MGFLAKKRSGANWDAFFVKQRDSGGVVRGVIDAKMLSVS